jgi:uncharacterized protein YxeA
MKKCLQNIIEVLIITVVIVYIFVPVLIERSIAFLSQERNEQN